MTEPTSGAVAAPFDLDALDFAKQGGLLPAVVQDARTRRVLMLGYMDRAAVEATLASGKVTFFSRSKNRLWMKGETSGTSSSSWRSPPIAMPTRCWCRPSRTARRAT